MIFSFTSLTRRPVAWLVAALAFAPAFAYARAHPHPAAAGGAGSYRGAVVMDAATGQVLLAENADEVSPPASMTKLMTYAVLFDKLSSGKLTLETPVPIDASDARIGGTQVFLDSRETFPVEDLIYAMMIQSANDAAHALARFSAGSVESFVAEMNAKARELGMTHTTFRSPHGLPPSSRRIADGDLTTPRDFAVLCRYLLLHTDVLKYTSVEKRDFGLNRKQGPMHMENHNKLLGKVSGVDGLKTGYTAGAGYCLSATAIRGGRRLIVVVMGSFGPGGKADFGHYRDIKATEFLERGFAQQPTGNSDFLAERAKYVKPPVIPLDGPAAPPAPSDGASTPAGAADTPSGGPTIKLALPLK